MIGKVESARTPVTQDAQHSNSDISAPAARFESRRVNAIGKQIEVRKTGGTYADQQKTDREAEPRGHKKSRQGITQQDYAKGPKIYQNGCVREGGAKQRKDPTEEKCGEAGTGRNNPDTASSPVETGRLREQ